MEHVSQVVQLEKTEIFTVNVRYAVRYDQFLLFLFFLIFIFSYFILCYLSYYFYIFMTVGLN